MSGLALMAEPIVQAEHLSKWYGQVSGLKHSDIYRVISFFPYTVPAIIIGILWAQMYDPSNGLLNGILTALGFDFFRAALYEDFLLAYFNADALATSNTQGAGGFALQCNLARFFHFRLVAAFQVSQQRLLLTVSHMFFGGGVRQTCLTHLLQQALYRCFDLIGQLFHRDLRHALLSSGRA